MGWSVFREAGKESRLVSTWVDKNAAETTFGEREGVFLKACRTAEDQTGQKKDAGCPRHRFLYKKNSFGEEGWGIGYLKTSWGRAAKNVTTVLVPSMLRSPSLFPKTFPYTKIRIDDSVFGAGPR
jgi:hypothetical protein